MRTQRSMLDTCYGKGEFPFLSHGHPFPLHARQIDIYRFPKKRQGDECRTLIFIRGLVSNAIGLLS